MTDDPEQPKREAAQRRALDVQRPVGALMVPAYQQRTQVFIPVNRNDLEDLRTFDGLSAVFNGVGLFFLSGGLWLGVEKLTDERLISVTPGLVLCGAAVVLGGFFWVAGLVMDSKKRGRITRIFNETNPTS